jgi:hypothetical protein
MLQSDTQNILKVMRDGKTVNFLAVCSIQEKEKPKETKKA